MGKACCSSGTTGCDLGFSIGYPLDVNEFDSSELESDVGIFAIDASVSATLAAKLEFITLELLSSPGKD